MSDLVEAVRARVGGHGLDICEPFQVKDYNALVHPRWALEDFAAQGGDASVTSLAVVIGASKLFWEKFLSWLAKFEELPLNPIDRYNTEVIEEAMKSPEFKDVKFEIRHAWANPKSHGKKFAHMQTAGHVAGVAQYNKENFWSLHPKFGTWFVYRAVVIFERAFPSELAKEPKFIPFTPEQLDDMRALTEKAKEENWNNVKTLVAIRERSNFPEAAPWRYEGDLLDYFYPVSRTRDQVLNDALSDFRKRDTQS